MPTQFEAKTLYDSLFDFQAGVNQGIAPLLLPKNQLAGAVNVTVRGTFATRRPSYRRVALSFTGGIDSAFKTGKWQGAGYYKPDNAAEQLCAVIGGRFFAATPGATTAAVIEPPVSGGTPPVPYPRPTTQNQAWLWQAEKWMIWTDGLSLPTFYDNVNLTQSNSGAPVNFTTTTTAAFAIPAVGATAAAVPFTATAPNLVVGDLVTIQNRGTFQVLAIVGLNVDLLNVTATPVGYVIASGSTVSWTHSGAQLPAGRMGAYGMGRVWMSLIDGKQFIASDLVGGSSGTVGNNYRDAVLNITENLYLAGGGNFTVPGSVGDIKAMRFTATMDVSLGQGPLQVLTPNTVFSCNAPVDRLTWQDVTNPILTESLISNGGLSQNATVLANGDMIFRSKDGIRSLKLARQEFATWGSTPSSLEVDPILREDSQSLLQFTSAVVFDNRLLMTTHPVLTDLGVYWKGIVALNFDPVSTLRGKAPAVYDGLWTGLNVLQIVVGEFASVERCFAFCFNTLSKEIELWEILKDGEEVYDNLTHRVTWRIESPVLDFGLKDPKKRQTLRLNDGEIYVDELQGVVDFQVYYRPDQWPCWVPWHSWSECAAEPDAANPNTANYQPQFRPKMGLGQPSPVPCDSTNDRPMREGCSFQVAVVITGQCRFLGGMFEGVAVPQSMFSKQTCCFYNPPVPVLPGGAGGNPNLPPSTIQLYRLDAVTQNDGTVAPITIAPGPSSTVVGLYGRIQNTTDGLWYEVLTVLMNDGVTYAPIVEQTSYPTDGGHPCLKALNVTDGKYYVTYGLTVGGTVILLLNQTPYASP
jgi:hypothetical protein